MKFKDLLKKTAWDKNEIENQIFHVAIGAAVFECVHYVTRSKLIAFIAVTIMAIVIETIQYFFFDNQNLKLPDRVRDIIFYQIGVLVMLSVRSQL